MSGNRIRESCDRLDALYSKLRSNDPETTSVQVTDFGRGCGSALGQALTNNTHVSSIVISIGYLMSPDDVDPADTFLATFLEFLRKSPSLRNVAIDEKVFTASPSLISLIFAAIAQNSRISSLHLEFLAWALQVCYHFLRTTTSLTRLRMGLNSIPENKAQICVDALNANQTLQEFELKESRQSMNLILSQMDSHPRLRSLAVVGNDFERRPCAGLSDFLRTTTALQDLTLDSYDFFQEADMRHLLAALATNHSVQRLRLLDHRMDCEASSLFSRFVRLECNQGSNKIQEIYLKPYISGGWQMNPAILVPSSVNVLSIEESEPSWSGNRIMESFFVELPKDSFACKIPCLRVSFPESKGIDAMIRYLPTATTFRKLVIFGSNKGFVYTHEFRKALRRNGSLHSLTIECDDGAIVDNTVLSILRAYCQRNHAVQELIESIDFQPGLSVSHLTLLPSLFCVVQQAPRTALNATLRMLLTCDSIGAF
jgi:hypothetical protein